MFCLFPAGCPTPTTSTTSTTTTTRTATTEPTIAESNCTPICNATSQCCHEITHGVFDCRVRPDIGDRMYCLMPVTFLSACQLLCLSINLSFHQFRCTSVWQTLSVLTELFFLTDPSLLSLFAGLKWKVFDEVSVSYRVQCLLMTWADVIFIYQIGLSSLSCSYFVVSFFLFSFLFSQTIILSSVYSFYNIHTATETNTPLPRH